MANTQHQLRLTSTDMQELNNPALWGFLEETQEWDSKWQAYVRWPHYRCKCCDRPIKGWDVQTHMTTPKHLNNVLWTFGNPSALPSRPSGLTPGAASSSPLQGAPLLARGLPQCGRLPPPPPPCVQTWLDRIEKLENQVTSLTARITDCSVGDPLALMGGRNFGIFRASRPANSLDLEVMTEF